MFSKSIFAFSMLFSPFLTLAHTDFCTFTVDIDQPTKTSPVMAGNIGNLVVPLCKVWQGYSKDPDTIVACAGRQSSRLYSNPSYRSEATCYSVLHWPIYLQLEDGSTYHSKATLQTIHQKMVLSYPNDFVRD